MTKIPHQSIIDQLPSSIAWKDAELNYLGANRNLIHSMGLNDPHQLIGINDQQLLIDEPHLSEFFIQQDLSVLAGNTIEILHTLDKDNNTYLLQKSPLRDEDNTIAGIILLCTPFSAANLFSQIKQIDQKYYSLQKDHMHYMVDENHNPIGLSTRELECLFLQIRGKTAKEIAEILKLSKRTVEYYIDNMKTKFGCFNKAELLTAAMSHGYQYHIPKTLLHLNLPQIIS